MRASRYSQLCKWRLQAHRSITEARVSSADRLSTPRIQTRAWINTARTASFFDFQLPPIEQSSSLQDQLPDILRQAQNYGIPSEAKLAYEANLGHSQRIGSRLTDHLANRQDLDLWAILLGYRRNKDGVHGVRDVLHGMQFRGNPVKLYTDDMLSEHMWRSLLSMGVEDEDIMHGLCDPDTGLGRERQSLFMDAMNGLLRHRKYQQARNIASMLRLSHFRGHEDMLGLFRICEAHCHPESIEKFRYICKVLPDAPIYHDAMAALWKGRGADRAWQLHKYLLSRKDLPTCFEDIEPCVIDLATKHQPIEPFIRQLEAADVSFTTQVHDAHRRCIALISEGSDSYLRSTVHGTRPRKLSDEFLARAFATKPLSFEFVLSSLQIFGLIEIGPLATRELALSAGDLPTMKQRLARLEKVGVDFGSSTFVTVIRNLCAANATTLYEAVLQSDQHHEVMEDREMQKRLLAQYYFQRDRTAVNRTLAILNLGKIGHEAQQRSRRLLLQSAVIVRDWKGATQLLCGMYKLGNSSTDVQQQMLSMSLNSLIDVIAYKESGQQRRKQKYLERGQYLVGMLQELLVNGISVGTVHWSRALFYLGESHNLYDMERMSLWLAQVYGPRKARGDGLQSAVNSSYPVILSELFDARFQAAVIEWSICGAAYQAASLPMYGQRAVRLIKMLHFEYGVPLDVDAIKHAFTKRIHDFFSSQKGIDIYSTFFEAVWLDNYTRVLEQKNAQSAQEPRLDIEHALQTFRDQSEANLFENPTEQYEANDDSSGSANIGGLVTDHKRWTQSTEDDVVEYHDLFHPSSDEYRR